MDGWSVEEEVRFMSKYGEFKVVRTERHKCKRSNDPSADEEGMRVYTYLKCPHCNTEDLEIATDNLKRDKHTVIRDHMLVCQSFTGERPPKRNKSIITSPMAASTAMVVAPNTKDEFEELNAKVAVLTQKMTESEQEKEEMKQEMKGQQQEIRGLQDKTCLYDGVLAAVMPSLLLPLTAPEQQAQLSIREAAIKDIRPRSLALMAPTDVIPMSMHMEMIGQKDTTIEQQNTTIDQQNTTIGQRDETIAEDKQAMEDYKKQLQTKDGEIAIVIQEKQDADKVSQQANKMVQEANKMVTSVTSRAERLQKERNALQSKFDALLKGKESRDRKRPGKSLLGESQEALKTAVKQHGGIAQFNADFQKRARPAEHG